MGRLGGHTHEQSNLSTPLYSSSSSSSSKERRGTNSSRGEGGGAGCVVTALGVDLSTLKGRTAFHEASRHQHYDTMELLLQAGADINAFMSMDLEPTVNTDLTALVQACLMDQPDTVRFLLRHGAKDSRLKALSRSLKGSLSSIAGILLCYNNQVREVAPDVARALSLVLPTSSSSSEKKKATSFLQLMWNSKNLKFIRREWLEVVACELPHRLDDRTCVIAQVDISSNQITELPIELFKLPSLTTLDISRNSIAELPCEEGKSNGGWECSRLSVLEAVKNQLSALPPCLFQLREVREVNASSNRVTTVPASVWSSPKLCKLYLSGNQLDAFPTPTTSTTTTSRGRRGCEGEEGEGEDGDDPVWNVSDSTSFSSPISPAESAVSDSGYRSSQHIDSMSMELNHVGTSTTSTSTSPPPALPAVPEGRERRPSLFQLPYGPINALSNLRTLERTAHTIQTHTVISRRLESFHDSNMEVEELDELEEVQLLGEGEEGGGAFLLEVLDLSGNQLGAIPSGLSCLAPKLTKLNLSKNRIKGLGSINDYPLDLEFLDVSYNDLHATIAPAASILDPRSHRPCARRQLSSGGQDLSVSMAESSVVFIGGTPGTPPYPGSSAAGTPLHQHQHQHQHTKLCSHRTHKNLRKLSTLKMNHNHLIDLQLFRFFSKNTTTTRTDLSTSLDDSSLPTHPADMSVGVGVANPTTTTPPENLSRSVNFIQRAHNLTSTKKPLPEVSTHHHHHHHHHEAESLPSSSESSQEGGGSGSRGEGSGSRGRGEGGSGGPHSPAMANSEQRVISPLYPTLATLELCHNLLRSVPSNIHRISTLSSLLLSHNKDIDTLPLELSNLEHLWNLEYEGCPLTNPPKEDLDKFRLASDKLLYMRSLLHE